MSQSSYDTILDLMQNRLYTQARELLMALGDDLQALHWLELLNRIEAGDESILVQLGLTYQPVRAKRKFSCLKRIVVSLLISLILLILLYIIVSTAISSMLEEAFPDNMLPTFEA